MEVVYEASATHEVRTAYEEQRIFGNVLRRGEDIDGSYHLGPEVGFPGISREVITTSPAHIRTLHATITGG